MQIFQNLWRVIFMLSTIVYVTDCCSSRILLLKEHTIKIVRHAQPQQNHHNQHHHHHQIYEHDSSSLQLQQKLPQHVDIVNKTVREYNKNFSNEKHSEDEESKEKDEEEEEEDDNSTTTDINVIDYTTRYEKSSYDDDDDNNNDDIYMENPIDFVTESIQDSSQLMPNTTTENSVSQDDETATDFTTAATAINSPSEFITTDPVVLYEEQQHTRNSKFHVIDKYYNIMRDVLSIKCYGQFLTDFCLNRGRCFRYPISNYSIFSCQCADGYIGERCEFKSVDRHYTPSIILIKDSQQPQIRMARFVISFPMLIVFSVIYLLIAALVIFRKSKNRAAGLLVS